MVHGYKQVVEIMLPAIKSGSILVSDKGREETMARVADLLQKYPYQKDSIENYLMSNIETIIQKLRLAQQDITDLLQKEQK